MFCGVTELINSGSFGQEADEIIQAMYKAKPVSEEVFETTKFQLNLKAEEYRGANLLTSKRTCCIKFCNVELQIK
eukprot:1434238-Prorocentrum_lima.AAC.1